MKNIAVIDVGSNSVRLMKKGGQSCKKVRMTQLGKGASGGMLSRESIEATLDAILDFKKEAEGYTLYCFATEAVRSAVNGAEFIEEVRRVCGIEIDLLSPEEEARAGYLGATLGIGESTVIDIGGASTEIVSGKEDKILSAISIPLGAARITSLHGESLTALYAEADKRFPRDIKVCDKAIAIGGTATTLGAIKAGLKSYDKDVVHGLTLTLFEVEDIISKLSPLSPEERTALCPVLPLKRAEVIIGGAVILSSVMKIYGIDALTLSDSDNAEGYLTLRSYEN